MTFSPEEAPPVCVTGVLAIGAIGIEAQAVMRLTVLARATNPASLERVLDRITGPHWYESVTKSVESATFDLRTR
jgi:hypothetical protein